MDWSYQLLSPHERLFLSRVAVFPASVDARGRRGGLLGTPYRPRGDAGFGCQGWSTSRWSCPSRRRKPPAPLPASSTQCATTAPRGSPRTMTTTACWLGISTGFSDAFGTHSGYSAALINCHALRSCASRMRASARRSNGVCHRLTGRRRPPNWRARCPGYWTKVVRLKKGSGGSSAPSSWMFRPSPAHGALYGLAHMHYFQGNQPLVNAYGAEVASLGAAAGDAWSVSCGPFPPGTRHVRAA